MAIDITTLGAANSYTNKHSGEGGTSDYSDLTNKPAINDVTLSGNKSSEDLGLQDALTFDDTPTEDSENPVTSDGVYKALGGKLDTLSGTSSDIGKLIIVDSDGNTIAISNILISDLVTTEDLHSAINGIFIVADELPTASEDTLGEIYLIPNGGENPNVRDEYLTTRDGTEGAYTYAWEKIGTTDIDLSGYVPTSRTIAGVDLEDDITASELREALNVENGAEANVQANWGQSSTAADDYIKNKPNIPSKVSDLENDSGFEANVQANWNEDDTSSDAYIQNKPTIPTVNNATLTIQKNGNNVQTFTANQASNATANIMAAENATLTTQNLNDVTTPGFYNAAGGNEVTNKPSGVNSFGLEVIHIAGSEYYVQILYPGTSAVPYRRKCASGVWGNWILDKLTDTTYSDATASASGLMSSSDKTKLNGIASGAEVNVQTDWNQSDNTADDYIKNKPTLGTAAAKDIGSANGVAELDSNGKVPSSQLPSYVDDVIEGYYDLSTDRFYEESAFTTVIPPEEGKSWVDVASNKSYRWTGSVYVRVDEGVQLGETASSAYRGDRGKAAYDHSQSAHARTDATKVEASSTNGNIKINGTETNVYTHPGSGTNPHGTTASDIGLGNIHVQEMNTSGDSEELRSIDDIYENVVFNKGFFAGSASITNDSVLPSTWYNIIWIPHRTGVGGGDNFSYGNFICIPMTSNSSTWYIVRFSNGTRAQTVPMKEFSGSYNDLADKPDLLITPKNTNINTVEQLNDTSTYPKNGMSIHNMTIPDYYIGNVYADGYIISIPWSDDNSAMRQFFIDDNNNSTIYVRSCNVNGVFSSWKSLAFSEDLPDTRGTQTVSGNPITITDAEPMNAESVVVELEPKQDLHGYDGPWVGGAGKNLLENVGTTATIEGVTFTVNDDGSVTLNRVSSSANNAVFVINTLNLKEGTRYRIVNSFANTKIYVEARYDNTSGTYVASTMADFTEDFVIPYGSDRDVCVSIVVKASESPSNVTVYPMLGYYDMLNYIFAPYSNICPISGYSEVNVERVGKNKVEYSYKYGRITATELEDGTIEAGGYVNNDYPYIATNIATCGSSLKVIVKVLSGNFDGCTYRALLFDGESEFGVGMSGTNQSHSYETSTEGHTSFHLRIYFYGAGNMSNVKLQVMVTDDLTATTYEPYQGSTATISLGGTKYGGTLDVTEGGYSDEWTEVVARANNTDGEYQISDNIVRVRIPNIPEINNAICSHFEYANSWDGDFAHIFYNPYEIFLYIPATSVQDAKDYLESQYNAGTPITICAKLANSTTSSTTPTDIPLLENTNNISTDGTNITLKYQPNNVIGECKVYTDEKCSEVLPPLPTTDGTYHLSCEVTSGAGVLSWVSDS